MFIVGLIALIWTFLGAILVLSEGYVDGWTIAYMGVVIAALIDQVMLRQDQK